jgi:hypothetical protein
MTNLDLNRWLELGQRRDPTPQEWAEFQRLLAENPGIKPDLELELLVNRALHRLPDQPVSSNFTDQVMQAVLQEPAPARPWGLLGGWRAWVRLAWVRQAALAGLVLCAGGLAYQQHVRHVRLEMAQSLVAVSGLLPESAPETVKDFEVIRRLSLAGHTAPIGSAPADLALLAAFQ